MTLDRAQRRRGRQQPPGELSIFNGENRIGAIRRRDARYVALDAAGRELGQYETLRGAVRAIPANAEIGGAA
jgi:hypothetical protein